MKVGIQYDNTSPKSIERYALRLLGKSLRKVLGEQLLNEFSGKGSLGQAVEKYYFGYLPNSNAEPDFLEAGVELKTTPLKKLKNNALVPKERLVFNIINYEDEVYREFENSSFWVKNKLLLLMMYLHEDTKDCLDYVFKIIRLWEFPDEDLKIIREDWQKIVSKVKAGLAHELSEGDTLYLGACTKGANKSSLRTQPNSPILARQRAFSLKPNYLKTIIDASSSLIKDSEAIEKTSEYFSEGVTFESYVISRINRFSGMEEKEIWKALGVKPSKAKNRLNILSKLMLGVRSKKVAEFEKAEVLMKTVRIKPSGIPAEHMSFKQIKYQELYSAAEWENSSWYEELNKRFFFVVFKTNQDNSKIFFEKALFWNMPVFDLNEAKGLWLDTRNKVKDGAYESFMKASQNKVGHVRPKARNSGDTVLSPQGTLEKKKCFWLNKKYLQDILN